MAVKRVTDSYAKGSLIGARRPLQSTGARAPALTADPARPPPPKTPSPQPKDAGSRISESVAAAIAAAIAELHRAPTREGDSQAAPQQKNSRSAISESVVAAIAADLAERHREPPSQPQPQSIKPAISENAVAAIAADLARLHWVANVEGEPRAPVDYHEIVANTVATLEHNVAETRHAVYECARQVVYQRLIGIRPALAPELVERERASLDRAIDKIEIAALEKQLAAAPAQMPALPDGAQPIQPVVISKPRRDLPEAKHLHSGALRLFAIVGLVCAGIFVYWLIAGRPEIKSAVSYLPALPGSASPDRGGNAAAPPTASTAENPDRGQSSASDDQRSETQQSTNAHGIAPQAQGVTGNADTNDTARALAANPLMNFKVECGGALCGSGYVSPSSPASSSDGASWIASYGTVKSPPSPGQTAPANARETSKLLEAGRAAAAPSAAGSYDRGMQKAKNGDSDGAIRDFTEAIRIDQNFADAYLQRGNARFKNGNPDLAIADFRDAIRIDPRNAGALKARGMARLYNADEDGALDDLSKAIQIAETEPARLPVIDLFFARRTRASIYTRKQAGDRELFDLSAMIDAYWKNPDLADALKGNYGVQGAASLMATIYRQRAALYLQRANSDGAIADLSFALQLDPARAIQLILERARVQEAAGRREQAAADFQRVLQLNPRIEEARQAVARLNTRP